MSTFNSEDNVSPENQDVSIESRTIPINEAGGTTQLKFNSQFQFGKQVKKIRIVNEDSVNGITYRIPSPSAPLRTVPPSTATDVPEYTYYVELNFDVLNITSYLEIDLVNRKDVTLRKSLVGQGAA